ncbi:MAG: hypothetical protein ACM3S0_02675 [Acidobacteriota bacterium]
MSSLDSPAMVMPSVSDLEQTMSQIQGIYAARVVFDENHELCEVHLVASVDRPPKHLVRDIETLVYVKHGIKIDYRKVSLVQLNEVDLHRLPVARPEIRHVVEDSMGDQKRVTVEIQAAGKVVRGEAIERVDNPTPLQTAARAMISCIEQLIGQQMDVRLDHATSLRLDSREIAIVVLTCLVEDREESFVGASFIGSRQSEAAARATLDALNRRIFSLSAVTQ